MRDVAQAKRYLHLMRLLEETTLPDPAANT